MNNDLIQVKNLSLSFRTDDSVVEAVRNVSFSIPKGKTLSLVGESGSGKSVTALSIMKLVPTPPGYYPSGEILYKGKDLMKCTQKQMQKIRGNNISMIFQEPMTSLNPVFTVGDQILESLILHKKMNRKEGMEAVKELLNQVGIKDPSKRVFSYPHELSGGQRQRIMIAMAISCEPDLLIADEPTTALDVTIQRQILELLKGLQEKYKMSMLFITHDLGIVANVADEVAVMYRGNVVEKEATEKVFKENKHPYTRGLIFCRPVLDKNPHRLYTIQDYMDDKGNPLSPQPREDKKYKDPSSSSLLLEATDIKTYFSLEKTFFGKTKSWIKAVDGVSLKIAKGCTLGLVGESGCGKTTLGRTLLKLTPVYGGKIVYNGVDITNFSRAQMRPLRRKMQIIFQDPYSSLNPRMTVGSAIQEPLIIHNLKKTKKERIERVEELMEKVGLKPEMLGRYPHEFSGGQRQRICIARALAVEPEFIVCDESVSALDVSVQAQILNLLLDLKEEFNLTYIFISHDLAVVKFFSDQVAVMKDGKIEELSDPVGIYDSPRSTYTKSLIEAIPQYTSK